MSSYLFAANNSIHSHPPPGNNLLHTTLLDREKANINAVGADQGYIEGKENQLFQECIKRKIISNTRRSSFLGISWLGFKVDS